MTSKIKVDNINKVSDDSNIINKCGTTVTVGAASDGVRTGANNLQASDGGNLISQSGTTITLGASGDTITLASGASQTGFGRTGTVDWQTGSIKTATFTAANGEGYFCNTAGGAFTVNLPAGVAGYIVSVQDYNNTFDTHNLTLAPNGSEKINGGAGTLKLSAEGQGLTLVYVDGTVGWRSVQENEFETAASSFVTATGGTITTCGNFKIHQFTGPGTFAVTQVGGASCAPNPSVADYFVLAGGGAGAPYALGGGGAGGFRLGSASPASTPLSTTGVTLTVQDYPITVGSGGAGSTSCQNQGSNSIALGITSTGGGAGGNSPPSQSPDKSAGGSGGAIGRDAYLAGRTTSNNGNSPPVSPPQGNNGGVHTYPSCTSGSRGGGGSGGAGSNGGPPSPGGAAAPVTPIFGASPKPYYTGSPANGSFGGGGGGGTFQNESGSGGGSAPGTASNLPSSSAGGNGQTNTGGGGGGSGPGSLAGGSGGSGIVLIRYKFQ